MLEGPIYAPHSTKTDDPMLHALLLASKQVGVSAPNPIVGCVGVENGRNISQGVTSVYRGQHAEAIAFTPDAEELFVTLEPCSYQGHQPSCAAMICRSPIKRIHIALIDPNPRVLGQGIQQLHQAGKEVLLGSYGRESLLLNLPFFIQHWYQRPMIALKWAQTLDGQLADDRSTSQWITHDRTYAHILRQRYDAVLIGAGTFLCDKPQLTFRHRSDITCQPLRILWDRSGALTDQDLSNFQGALFSPVKRNVPCHILLQPGASLVSIFDSLPRLEAYWGRCIQSIMIEGGPSLLTHALECMPVDIAHAMIAPIFTGGTKNRIALHRLLSEKYAMKLLKLSHHEDDTYLELSSLDLNERYESFMSKLGTYFA